MKDYKEILKGVVNIINTTEKTDIGFANICTYIGENCPELKENEDERIRKQILSFLKEFEGDHYRNLDFSSWIAWLEKQKHVDAKPHIPDRSSTYDKGYEEAQKYLSERGFDIPWNDSDVFVDERYITQTVANVLAWGDEHPKQKIEQQDKAFRFVWHSVSEEPIEDKELLCEWESNDATWHDIAFYHADTKTFWHGEIHVVNVTRWLYVDDLREKQDEQKEKQGEQILANSAKTCKVEPKFKVGDWITNDKGHSYLIAAIDNNRYLFEIGGYTHEQMNWEYIENADNHYHIWSIKDAKDGDILISGSNSGFIYNGKFNEIRVGAYCGLNVINNFIIAQHESRWTCNYDIKPSTKEQRDSLIKAMTEAGYVFDFDKKELKKVNSDVQSTKSKYTENDVITGELLIKNGFEHRSGKFSDCYDIKFNAEGYIDLIQDKKSNTEWTLEILKHNNDDDHSTCANRLVETISTIKELQDCLDKMNINLKIKY